jgi:hypothetical protein
METSNAAAGDSKHPHPEHLVAVTVDGDERTIPRGEYKVSALKALLRIPPEYELDLVVHGEFQPLADDSEIKVKQHMVLVSHVRCGGSA